MKNRHKVLVVDDEPHIRRLIHTALARADYAIVEAADAREALDRLRSERPDISILDLGLPDRDGLELVPLFKQHSDTTLIIVSARDATEEKVTALDLGADDYLTKPFSFLELVERLHALARRTRAQESTLISVGDLYVDLIGRRATRDGVRLDLTAKEFQLLSVLARRHGDILSKTAITELVWEVDFESHTNVVETAIKRLRAKLDGPFRTKLLHTVRGMGYVLEVREARDTRETREDARTS